MHDRAFDKGNITIMPDYKVKISKYFEDFADYKIITETFHKYDMKEILLPDKFLQDTEFLHFHNEKIFRK